MKFALFIAIGGFFLLGCNTTSQYVAKNYSYLYDSTQSLLQPSYKIFHHTTDSSTLFFRINSDDLIYTRSDQASPFKANIAIHYRLYESLNSKFIVDSLTTQIIDINPNKSTKVISSGIPFFNPSDKNCYLMVKFQDLNREKKHETLLFIDNEQALSEQDFYWKTNGELQTTPLLTQDNITLNTRQDRINTFKIDQYNDVFGLARPPFANGMTRKFDYMPDQLLETKWVDGVASVSLPDTGFLFIHSDTAQKTGFALFRFNNDYPVITTGQGLLKPLRYLTTKEEFKWLSEHENPKSAIEKFWIEKCGNQDRAREIIKQFYSRVHDANRFFSSYVEGWKSDRGMIFLVFGPPSYIKKRSDSEIWMYGDQHALQQISFTFYKMNNPLSSNDFKLERSIDYKSIWHEAISAWRSGRVYSGNR